MSLVARTWNEEDHPRVPAGSPDGGQFGEGGDTNGNDGGNGDASSFEKIGANAATTFKKIGGGTVDPKTKYGDHTDDRPGVGMYAGLGNSYVLNESLRKGEEQVNEDYNKILNDLTAEIDKSLLPTNVVTLRFVEPEFAEQLKVGNSFIDPAFISTTLSPKIIEKHRASVTAKAGAILRLHLQKGKAATAVKGSSEYEIIIQRGSQFKVTNIKEISGSTAPRWHNKIIDVDVT